MCVTATASPKSAGKYSAILPGQRSDHHYTLAVLDDKIEIQGYAVIGGK
jgi:hypothetical protein